MIKEDMDETNSGYAKQVGGLKGKKIDTTTFEYEAEVKESKLNIKFVVGYIFFLL